MRRALLVCVLMCAGCGSPLCEDHRALQSATKQADREVIEERVYNRVRTIIGVEQFKHRGTQIPRSDCPACDKLIERALMARSS